VKKSPPNGRRRNGRNGTWSSSLRALTPRGSQEQQHALVSQTAFRTVGALIIQTLIQVRSLAEDMQPTFCSLHMKGLNSSLERASAPRSAAHRHVWLPASPMRPSREVPLLALASQPQPLSARRAPEGSDSTAAVGEQSGARPCEEIQTLFCQSSPQSGQLDVSLERAECRGASPRTSKCSSNLPKTANAGGPRDARAHGFVMSQRLFEIWRLSRFLRAMLIPQARDG